MATRKLSLKWFGSVTNLSIRRSSDKDDAAKSCDVTSHSADDVESCLRPPGYARSSDMYTHVGTVPRWQRQKKKSVRGGGRQREAGERVRDSPLLSALSSLSGSRTPRPEPPRGPPGRPLPEDPVTRHRAAGSQRAAHSLNMARPAAVQDVYVPMDPIADRSSSQMDDTLPEAGSQDQDQDQDRSSIRHDGGEYVKFSKERWWLEPPTDTLRKQLEEELKLSERDVRSHAWYHGPIPKELTSLAEDLPLKTCGFLLSHVLCIDQLCRTDVSSCACSAFLCVEPRHQCETLVSHVNACVHDL